MEKVNKSGSIFVLLCSILLASLASGPGQAKAPADENLAVIIGESGEQYPIYGAGGIRVSGGHHGIWMSNMKRSAIEIDGSGISAQRFVPVTENSDFTASALSAYFVSGSSVCTLPPASSGRGQEIVVCNASDGTTIAYQTVNGERLLGASQSGQATNSALGKVDRFISDGRSWYKE